MFPQPSANVTVHRGPVRCLASLHRLSRPPLQYAQACSSSTTINQPHHSLYGHTSTHPKPCNTTCFSDVTAGCGSMPAHTVLLLPAGAMIGFWESSRCAAAAVVPDSSTHHETIHHAGDAGITLYRDHLPIDVDLVCSNGAPCLLYTSPSPRD